MKKRSLFVFIMCLMMCLMIIPVIASAEDVLLEKKIVSMTVDTDKNGAEYVRFIINENRELNGMKYQVGVAVMAFGNTVENAKKLTEGKILKVIAASGEYRGNKNYIIRAFITG